MGSLSQNFGGRVLYIREELSQVGALGYCTRVWEWGFQCRKFGFVSLGRPGLRTSWDGWMDAGVIGRKCREVENGDVIVNMYCSSLRDRLGEV